MTLRPLLAVPALPLVACGEQTGPGPGSASEPPDAGHVQDDWLARFLGSSATP